MAERVYVEEAGCVRRRIDAATIREYLRRNGYEAVDEPSKADKIVCVTCAFKKKEEEESVARLRSLRRYDADVLVYGCLSAIAGERYHEFDDLPSVAPGEIQAVEEYFAPSLVPFSEIPQPNIVTRAPLDAVRMRRMLESGSAPSLRELAERVRNRDLPYVFRRAEKASAHRDFSLFVSRGCRGACSFCAIRKAIGDVASKPREAVVAELTGALDAGFTDFSILGDDPGCWGLDISQTLPDLLGGLFDACAAFNESRGMSDEGHPVRLRIRDIHPKHLIEYHEQILEHPSRALISNVLCPVQSGSDRILGLMRRQHTSSELLTALRRVRELLPEATLDTQIIVGFPSETAQEFRQTLDFVRDAGFQSVVVFPYDDKDGTLPSSHIAGKVAEDELRRRFRDAFRYFRHEGVTAYSSCPD